ncbi:MAG: hypothetical protein AB1453_02950 [Chloroflexota bacterium]
MHVSRFLSGCRNVRCSLCNTLWGGESSAKGWKGGGFAGGVGHESSKPNSRARLIA